MKRSLCLVVLMGCVGPRGPSIKLESPPPNAPFEERKAAFESLKALGVGGEKSGVFKKGSTRYLELASSKTVYEPEDLLPVVKPDSATARAARDYRDARNTRRIWRNVAVAAVAVGTGLIVGGALMGGDNGFKVLGTGVFAVLGGTAGLMNVVGGNRRWTNHKSVEAAFKHYDESLAANLRVCVRGTELVDCDAR